MDVPHRPLTDGEIAITRSIFGEAVDPGPVRLVRRKWWPFQPRGIVMAPCGHIHFHPADDNWREDFSTAPLSLQGLFIHEMTHIWQAQKRGRFYLPLMRHPFCRYRYTVREGRPLDLYGLEQQAEILRHVFLMRSGRDVPDADKLATLADRLPFGPG